MITEGARLLDVVAKFFGLETISSVWYFTLAIFAFFVVGKVMLRIINDHADLKCELKLFDQRQVFQSEFMQMQESRYNDAQEEIRRLNEVITDFAIDAALCKLLLANNNITPIDIPK